MRGIFCRIEQREVRGVAGDDWSGAVGDVADVVGEDTYAATESSLNICGLL